MGEVKKENDYCYNEVGNWQPLAAGLLLAGGCTIPCLARGLEIRRCKRDDKSPNTIMVTDDGDWLIKRISYLF